MLLVYSPEENQRVKWTFDLLLRQLLGIQFRVTDRTDEILEYDGPRLSYSFFPIDDIPLIGASGLLFEKNIRDQSLNLAPGETWKGLPVIFPLKEKAVQALLPFDVFSALFYFVTRYEEYLPFRSDEHERFPSSESLAYRLKMVEEPLVNHWALALGEALARVFGDAVKQESPGYRFIPTIDVDNAYAYARKGLKRTIGGLWRDRRDMEARNFRFQVLRNNQPDPYDTYSLLHRFHHNFKVEPVWFFLVGQYGKFDKNINPRNTRFKALISSVANDFDTGLHPSYASNHSAKLLKTEAGILAGITGKPVVRSRQHYLKISFPDTYRLLAEAGIREDYSLGFADRPGFRAGIANPFRFFDLSANMATGLTIYPFQVMDTSIRQYLGLNPGEAVGRITDIIGKIRRVNGTFISLWHNESLSEWKEWQGWSEVYWQLLHAACKAG